MPDTWSPFHTAGAAAEAGAQSVAVVELNLESKLN